MRQHRADTTLAGEGATTPEQSDGVQQPVPHDESKGRADAAKPQRISYLASVWAIVWKDLTIERRTRQMLSVTLVFSLTAVIVFNFALYGDLAAAREVSTGFLWITILLAGTLGLNRSLMSEQENRSTLAK